MEGMNNNSDDGGTIHSDGDNCLDNGLDNDAAAAPNDESEPIFRSSLFEIFQDSRSSKTDACAVFCCGIYLFRRNQDLLLRDLRKEDGFADGAPTSPPLSSASMSSTIAKRPLEISFLLLVTLTLVIWSFDRKIIFSTTIGSILLGLLLVCAIWKIFQFQNARKTFRRELAIAEYYRRRRRQKKNTDGHEDENDLDLAVFLEQHRQEIYGDGAHTICCCAKSRAGYFGSHRSRDDSQENEISNIDNDDNDNDDDQNEFSGEFCSNAWRFLSKLCRGMLCGCYLQLFGMCAIAQESRHLRDALPTTARPGLWQRDYITMQPWMEYYPSILRLRFSNQIHCLPHFKALSTLSRRILIAAAAVLLFGTLLFLFPIRFPKWQVLILYGTFLQPAVFLFFVHWLWNRLDLSVDAVVKYFACGFFICTCSAVVYELCVSKLAEKLVMLVDRLGSEGLELFGDHTYELPNGEQRVRTSPLEHPMWYQLTEALFTVFVTAFFVAGLTEEVCKYMCFWMVEHPDLELENRVMLLSSSARRETDKHSGKSNHEDSETTSLLSQDQSTSLPPSDPEQQAIFAPTASLVSVGEAITVAMITVALGFATAENLLYIFVYTSPGFNEEIGTLYMRCLFPIHPMAAALQSIGVCRRDLEKDASVGFWKILLPACLLHGMFDFSLMVYPKIKEILDYHNYRTFSTDPHRVEHGGGNTVDTDGGQSFLMYVMLVPFFAMVYHLNESYYQTERLKKIDEKNRTQASTN